MLQNDAREFCWRLAAAPRFVDLAQEWREGLRALPLLLRIRHPDPSRKAELRARAELLLRETEIRALSRRLAEAEERAARSAPAPAAVAELDRGVWWAETLAPPEEAPIWVGDMPDAWEEARDPDGWQEDPHPDAVTIEGRTYPLDDPEAIAQAREALISREVEEMVGEAQQIETSPGSVVNVGYNEYRRIPTMSTRTLWAPWLESVTLTPGVTRALKVLERAARRRSGRVWERLRAQAIRRLEGLDPRPGREAEPCPEWEALLLAEERIGASA